MDKVDRERLTAAANRAAAPSLRHARCVAELVAALVDCMDVIWQEFHTTPADNVNGTLAEKPYNRALAAIAAHNKARGGDDNAEDRQDV